MSTSTAGLNHRDRERQYSFSETPAWKEELNAKLEAHRRRRGPQGPLAPIAAENLSRRDESFSGRDGAPASRAALSQVAARVAERYAKAPSYREVLEANAAASAAALAAQAAATEAHQAAHNAAQMLLANFEDGEERGEPARVQSHELRGSAASESDEDFSSAFRVGSTVEHPHPLPVRGAVPERAPGSVSARPGIVDAFAEAEVPPAVSLPAKLIEFPRELVAAHKARPRLAEGPLLDEAAAEPASLRIFEVQEDARRAPLDETVAVAHTTGYSDEGREAVYAALAPEPAPAWQSIRLGEHPGRGEARDREELTLSHRGRVRESQARPVPTLHVASLSDRGMAALVDLASVGSAFLLFVLVFTACTTHPPVNKTSIAVAGAIFAAIAIFYEWLLLTWGGATLGMRYAQIALCTFDDENPVRRQRPGRVWATLAALLPLGLGLLWAVFDEDSLGWHDRMTRTYQRSYR